MATEIDRPRVGGALSLDLLNTIWGTNENRSDWLVGDAEIVDFASEHGARPEWHEVDAVRGSLSSARELIHRLMSEGTDGPVSEGLTSEIDAILGDVTVRLTTEPIGIEITGESRTNRLAIAALLDAISLLAERPERIRSCDHGECTLWFVDTSKAGRRRWCSMEICGNRAKAKRHYDKTSGRPTDNTPGS